MINTTFIQENTRAYQRSYGSLFVRVVFVICLGFWLFTVSLLTNTTVLAQEPDQDDQSKQVDQFEGLEGLLYQDQQQLLLNDVYTDPDFIVLIDTSQARIDLQDLSDSFLDLQEQYETYSEQRSEIEEKYGDVQQSIERILKEGEITKSLVLDTLTKISLFSKRVELLKEDIRLIETDYNKSKEDLQDYTKFLYYLFNNYHGRGSTNNDISLLVKSENVAESLSMNDSVIILTKYLQTLLDTMKAKQREHVQLIFELNKVKMAYRQAGIALQNDLAALDEQKTSLYDLLAYLQTTKNLATSQASIVRGSQASIAQQINQLRQMTNTGGRAQEGTIAADLLSIPDKEESDTYLTWPVLGAPYIERYFNDEFLLESTGEKFTGIRMEVPQRTPVFAAAPGIVYKVLWNDDLSQGWIILLHKFGYATFYTPINEIYVEEGALIARGAIIGMSGGQPGTKGAGLDSESPRLDFGVTKNGQSSDPLLLLDLSVYDHQDTFPEKYQPKFLKNLFERQVPIERLGVMPGATVAERRNSFLARYARGVFADPALWIDAAYDTGIDPIFGMCIGFAETSFRNFKSANNIGNVGNNDRGDVVEFSSPIAGARALFGVFNNRYLGAYNTLNELSRFGNRDGFIYASSPYNRQKNIMECLSSIYGYRIPEDFPYRRRK